MLNKATISSTERILIIYIVLAAMILAVYWQVSQFDFVNLDDYVYVKENSHIAHGITLEGIRWAFSTTYAEFWHPLTWLSLMLDYQLYGLNAGGYHMTNVILHILSTLLLFRLFNRMTGAIWKSAFVAAFFAIHPLRVESVAWIAERKDVLSLFLGILTLCLYVYYTEKPDIKKYLLVLFSFACSLMSKSIVVTMPVIMILLDYWPLKRFDSSKDNSILWQLKEKTPFFILSAFFSIITILVQPNSTGKGVTLGVRLANAPIAFVTYLEKTFWPHDLAVFYPFPSQIPMWQILGASLLTMIISIAVIVMVKRLPYIFVGWFWYVMTIAPVIGIIKVGNHAMADRYHYIPSIGLAVILAWGIPELIRNEERRKKTLFPAGLVLLVILSILSWKQCGYWENSISLFNHTLQITKNNFIAHDGLGIALLEEGKTEKAINHFSEVIRINPNYANGYNNRGISYCSFVNYQHAIKDFNKAIQLKPGYAPFFYHRGSAYDKQGQYQTAINDYNEAIRLKPDYADAYNNRGGTYFRIGQYQTAINDYNEAIRLKPDYADAYNNRAFVYLEQGAKEVGCSDARKACGLGNCRILKGAQVRGLCH